MHACVCVETSVEDVRVLKAAIEKDQQSYRNFEIAGFVDFVESIKSIESIGLRLIYEGVFVQGSAACSCPDCGPGDT